MTEPSPPPPSPVPGPSGPLTGPAPSPAPAPARRRRPPAILFVGSLFALGIVALGIAAWWVTLAVERPYKGWPGEEVFVEIPRGASVDTIARTLQNAGVIERPFVFRLAVRQRGAANALKAGEYRFAEPVSPRRVVDRLARGEVFRLSVTFPEGLTFDEMASMYEAQRLGRARDFLVAAGDESLIADLDAAATDLEGYLFPDTYELSRRTSARDLVRNMVTRFREVAGKDVAQRAAARGMSVREVMTLASLVEKETAKDAERPIVAGVYANRLRIGMGMQCDPTVIYALKRAGRWDGNLTREGLRFDSPYNTYRYAGLPPGPIASPGRASIEAALAPADVPYLYFVSRNDGSHVFATTLDEHNENVHKFQREYFREKRARDAEGTKPD